MSDPRKYEEWQCPRCGQIRAAQYPSLSRVDNESYICNICGNDEALVGIVPVSDWPIDLMTRRSRLDRGNR